MFAALQILLPGFDLTQDLVVEPGQTRDLKTVRLHRTSRESSNRLGWPKIVLIATAERGPDSWSRRLEPGMARPPGKGQLIPPALAAVDYKFKGSRFGTFMMQVRQFKSGYKVEFTELPLRAGGGWAVQLDKQYEVVEVFAGW